MKQPYDLALDDRAGESVRKILHSLFGTLRSNVDGMIADAHIEFLHDLRVANRRTRSALSQIKAVLPTSVLDAFQPEFKWLGDVTGRCRDLDVALIALDSYRRRPAFEDGALDPLCDFLKRERHREHGRVCDALQSERFHRLVKGWSIFLETGTQEESRPPLSSVPIIEVANVRILKAYRRMRKRGSGDAVDPPFSLLHRLRIDGKKLRYLLEFFNGLYPPTTVTMFIRELKQLQDILGEFNDTEVQLGLIQEFENHSVSSEETSAATRNLTEAIADRQRQLRDEFSKRFELFASEESRKLYRKTFKR
jgi:CHAD domain-containing protein